MVSKYDEELDQELKDTQQITSEMNVAIEQEQFEVYLQPKYSLRSEKLIGAEALVRWKHPERGMISPGVFIPAFEKYEIEPKYLELELTESAYMDDPEDLKLMLG